MNMRDQALSQSLKGKTNFLVMAVPRSGTTLFARLMNAHPDVLCGSERFHGHSFSPRHLSEVGFRTLDLERATVPQGLELLEAKIDRPNLIFGEKLPRSYFHLAQVLPRFEAEGERLKIIVLLRDVAEVANSWYRRAANEEDKHWDRGMFGAFPYVEQFFLAGTLAGMHAPEDILLVSYAKMLSPVHAPAVFARIAEHLDLDDAQPFLDQLDAEATKTKKSLNRDRSADTVAFHSENPFFTRFATIADDAGTCPLSDVQVEINTLVTDCLADKELQSEFVTHFETEDRPETISYQIKLAAMYAEHISQMDASFAADICSAMRQSRRRQISVQSGQGTSSVLNYDITDALYFLSVHSSVTGIPRVQIDAILNNEWAHGCRTARAVFLDPVRGWLGMDMADFSSIFSTSASLQDAAKAALEHLKGSRPIKIGANDVFLFLGATWTAPELSTTLVDLQQLGARVVMYLHDVLPLEVPEYFPQGHADGFSHWLKGCVTHCDGFICNSNETKDALLSITNPQMPVSVVDLNVMPSFVKQYRGLPAPEKNSILCDLGLEKLDYVLAVGTFEPRKNISTLLNAWTAAGRHFGDACPKLVLVGKDGWKSAGIYELLDSIAERFNVVSLNNVSDLQLAALYDRALLTVAVSRKEGWNLPITESLAMGTPCLAGLTSGAAAAMQGLTFPVDALSERDLADRLIERLGDRSSLVLRRAEIARRSKFKAWTDFLAEIETFAKGLPTKQNSTGKLVRHTITYNFGGAQSVDWTSPHLTGVQMRAGRGWNAPDSWGCWSKSSKAEIALLDLPPGAYCAYAVVTTHDKCGVLSLEVTGPDEEIWCGRAYSDRRTLISMQFEVKIDAGEPAMLRFASGEPKDFKDVDDSADTRTLGFALIELKIVPQDDASERTAALETMIATYLC